MEEQTKRYFLVGSVVKSHVSGVMFNFALHAANEFPANFAEVQAVIAKQTKVTPAQVQIISFSEIQKADYERLMEQPKPEPPKII